MNKFSNRLKELRADKKISQVKLAKAIKTTNSSICDWECGRCEPDIDTLVALCKFFEVSADYILGLED